MDSFDSLISDLESCMQKDGEVSLDDWFDFFMNNLDSCMQKDEKVNAIISSAPKTENDFLNNYNFFKSLNLKELNVMYAYGQSGGYTCGYFCPVVYEDLVVGRSKKGYKTDNINKIKKKDAYYKCFFQNDKLIYAEHICLGNISERIYFIYEENRIINYLYHDELLNEINVTVYKDGYINSYLTILVVPNLEGIVRWERLEYVYDYNGISKLIDTDSFGEHMEYSFICDNGYVKSYLCDGDEYTIKKNTSAFMGKQIKYDENYTPKI